MIGFQIGIFSCFSRVVIIFVSTVLFLFQACVIIFVSTVPVLLISSLLKSLLKCNPSICLGSNEITSALGESDYSRE